MRPPLRVAIVHYHLKRGGVTRIIESTLRGLRKNQASPVEAVVLSGEVPEDFNFKEQAQTVEGLHYSNSQSETPTPVVLLRRMREAAAKALGSEPDIWHIHNHSLGKNEAMPGVVSLLAEAGDALLLQMHDFAEDGRPQNHRCNQVLPEYSEKLYPLGSRIQYALINARDLKIFADVNLPEENRHLLANPVEVTSAPIDQKSTDAILSYLEAERLFLYPVRALRRKNPGELLLWSALAQPGEVFATTLGPTNPEYYKTYKNWQTLASNHRLPVHLGISDGIGQPFHSIVQAAECILTTSIAEGFGLSFLEPWLYGKPVAGRDLPEITADFREADIELGQLYQSLPIPGEWIDTDTLHGAIHHHLTASYAAYGTEPPPDATQRALEAIRPSPGFYDFAGLNESLQSAVIDKLAKDPKAREALPLNSLEIPAPGKQAEKICRNYSLEVYTQKLHTLYRSLSDARTSEINYLQPGKILENFLMPERFRLLRT